MEKTGKLLNYMTAGVLALAAFAFSSCKDENNETPEGPTATAPGAVTSVQIETGSDVTFNVTVPGGYKSSTVSATGGTAAIISEPSAGAASGNVVVTFTAGAAEGAGSLVLTVTDKNNKATTATAVMDITALPPNVPVEVSGAITSNTTWTKDKQYLLKGNVYVRAPAELTIEAGTVIFGDKVSKGALIINRGAKIHAVGTAATPIVFTSSAPVNYRNYGDWGGVVLLGKATNNQGTDRTIEGVTGTSGDDGKYGGTDDADNSGELQYARIEFAGIALSTDNELNGLTFGSVGSGTTIDHIQVSYSGDDSYEWFGGAVNAKYLIAYRGWDDDFDTDFGYHGSVQFAVSHRDPNIADKSGSNGFESDNDGSGTAATPLTSAKMANISWFGPGVYAALKSGDLSKGNFNANFQFGGHIRRNTALQIYNSIFVGSYLEGVHFDKTNPAAVFKGNYFARIGAAVSGTVKKATTGNASGDIDLTNFDADNFNTTGDQAAVDQSAVIAGLGATNVSVDAPLSLLASASSLLTGAATVPAPLVQVDYIGAFDATNDWTAEEWVDFDPNGTAY